MFSIQLPALFPSRESATLEHWSFSALQFPRTILTLNAHGLCSARLDVQATYHIHISPRKRSPTANIILPTQSGSDSLIHIMSHTHNCQFCIKEKHWHIASSCTHYWREWLLNEIIASQIIETSSGLRFHHLSEALPVLLSELVCGIQLIQYWKMESHVPYVIRIHVRLSMP